MKTVRNDASVADFIARQPEPARSDCETLARIMSRVSGDQPAMYGDSIVGFGKSIWTYADGKTMEWLTLAFAPRKSGITVYLKEGFDNSPLYENLGRAKKTGKGCLAIKKLSDVDLQILEALIQETHNHFAV